MLSTLLDWIEEFFKPPDDGVSRYHQVEIEDAVCSARRAEVHLDEFREDVKKYFPHRVEALALADEVDKTPA